MTDKPTGVSAEGVEDAERGFDWTPERRRITARAQINIKLVRRGRLTPEEALWLTIFPPDDPRYEAVVEKVADELPVGNAERKRGRTPEERKAAERDRYHNDAAYRERRLAQFRERRSSPEYKAKERERAARRRKARAS
jgi:hypothetical protein